MVPRPEQVEEEKTGRGGIVGKLRMIGDDAASILPSMEMNRELGGRTAVDSDCVYVD